MTGSIATNVARQSTSSDASRLSVLSKTEETPSTGSELIVWLVVGFGAVGGILFGMDQANFAGVETKDGFADDFCVNQGFSNQSTLELNRTECHGHGDFTVPREFTNFQSWGSSLVQLGAAAGVLLFAPTVTRKFGRRAGLASGCLVVLLAMIWNIMTTNIPSFYMSRFVTGLGVGVVTFALPMWTAELAPKHIRGTLGCTMQLAVVIGSQIAAGINIPDHVEWRHSLGAPIAPAALVMLFIYFFPESPRFLFQSKGAKEARSTLVKLRGTDNVDEELLEIEESIKNESQEAPWSVLWTDKSIRKRVIIANMLQWMQQFTGINALLGQGPKLFAAAGVPMTGNQAGFFTSAFNLVGTIVMMIIIDKKGRRPLLLFGAVGMFVFMAAAGIVAQFMLYDVDASKLVRTSQEVVGGWLLLALVCMYFMSFAIAWGGIPWVYPAEIFPMDVKEKALSTSVFSQWIANWLIAFITPKQVDIWGVPATFYFYAAFIVLSTAFVYFYIPEIKGVAIEDMDTIFGERKYNKAQKDHFVASSSPKTLKV